MFLTVGIQVPCVNLPADVDLGDIHPWAASLEAAADLVAEGKSSALLYFVENSAQLEKAHHPSPLQLDGDVIGEVLEVDFSLQHKALKIRL